MTSRERAENAVRIWHETPSCGLNVCIQEAIDAAVAEATKRCSEHGHERYCAGREDERDDVVTFIGERQDCSPTEIRIGIEHGDHITPEPKAPRYEVREVTHDSATAFLIYDNEARYWVHEVHRDHKTATMRRDDLEKYHERLNGGAA